MSCVCDRICCCGNFIIERLKSTYLNDNRVHKLAQNLLTHTNTREHTHTIGALKPQTWDTKLKKYLSIHAQCTHTNAHGARRCLILFLLLLLLFALLLLYGYVCGYYYCLFFGCGRHFCSYVPHIYIHMWRDQKTFNSYSPLAYFSQKYVKLILWTNSLSLLFVFGMCVHFFIWVLGVCACVFVFWSKAFRRIVSVLVIIKHSVWIQSLVRFSFSFQFCQILFCFSIFHWSFW